MHLSEDQGEALGKVLQNIENGVRETTLTGPAGSGKTTLTSEIVHALENRAVLAAPTGKAAVVLRDKVGRQASTIHRLLYGGAFFDKEAGKLKFRNRGQPCNNGDVLIVDESSMVGQKLYHDIFEELPPRAQVLWVGDKEQLEPVNDTWGPDLLNPTAALTKVHRQAEKSIIIRYATAVREGRSKQWETSYKNDDSSLALWDGIDSAIEWLVDARLHQEDATLLTFTHDTRKYVNTQVRDRLGLLKNDSDFCVGEHVVIRSNNHSVGLMNGEVVTISAVEKTSFRDKLVYEMTFNELPGVPVLVMQEHIELSREGFGIWSQECGLPKGTKDKFMLVHYGQCITVHSSQGSQWKKVGFINDNAYRKMSRQSGEAGRRFLYTAVTRAQENLAVFME